jgi:hypothetical protein
MKKMRGGGVTQVVFSLSGTPNNRQNGFAEHPAV